MRDLLPLPVGRYSLPGMTGAAHTGLIEDVRARLAAAGDPARAETMRAYMKSALPYHGVPSPACRTIFRELLAEHPLDDRDAWLATIRALWDGATHREEWYAALALARHRRYAAYRDPDALDLYRHLVVTGAWWDVVDDVATHLVGPLLLAHPDGVRPEILRWATDEDRWLRRSAVICQVGAKGGTDLELLSAAVEANLDDRDFFLRKAIGWALRQHARVDPGWVRTFVAAHDDRLSGLSRREALKHVGAA
jgi:3-methyladenine DNA glycosylase AlkD